MPVRRTAGRMCCVHFFIDHGVISKERGAGSLARWNRLRLPRAEEHGAWGMERGAWSLARKLLASVMQIIGQLSPRVIFLRELPRTAAAVGQLGAAATDERNEVRQQKLLQLFSSSVRKSAEFDHRRYSLARQIETFRTGARQQDGSIQSCSSSSTTPGRQNHELPEALMQPVRR